LPETDVLLPNPLGFIPGSVIIFFFGVPWAIMLLTTVAMCVAAVFVRYRRAAAQERVQIKWFLYACVVFMVIYPLGFFLADDVLLDVWSSIVFDLAILTFPTSIGIAILHYRLYDIDIIIRRTLIYSVLTALLALIYFGSVVVLQSFVWLLTGDTQSDLVTIAATLAIAALFQPVRRRIQAVIDRRFYRRKYDAQQTLQAFSVKMRDETDLDQLTGDLVQVAQATLQPAHVSVWLRELERGRNG
jgi:hypothetical protein